MLPTPNRSLFFQLVHMELGPMAYVMTLLPGASGGHASACSRCIFGTSSLGAVRAKVLLVIIGVMRDCCWFGEAALRSLGDW